MTKTIQIERKQNTNAFTTRKKLQLCI